MPERGRHVVALVVDAAVVSGSWLLASRVSWPDGVAGAAAAPSDALLVAAIQIAVFAAVGVYRSRPLVDKIGRLIAGAIAGTGAGVLVLSTLSGGPPWEAAGLHVALFLPASLGWRAARVLWTSRRTPPDPLEARFVDRTTERLSVMDTIADIAGHAELLRNLVLRDLKLKYRGSVLGFLWSLAYPVALVIVYTFAFKIVLRHPQPDYPYFVLLGLLAWTFFANASSMSTGAITDSTGLVRAVRFPRAVLPVATVLFNLAQFLLTVLVFLPIMLIALGRPLVWPMALFPVILALQASFAIGVALLLSAVTTRFRDVRHLVDVALPLLFWTTPILYPASQVPESLRAAILLSPMSPFVVAYQRIFYDGLFPDRLTTIVAAVYGLSMLALGAVVFLSIEDELAERI